MDDNEKVSVPCPPHCNKSFLGFRMHRIWNRLRKTILEYEGRFVERNIMESFIPNGLRLIPFEVDVHRRSLSPKFLRLDGVGHEHDGLRKR